MTTLAVPAQKLDVLDQPLTRIQFDQAPDHDEHGRLSRVVSVDLDAIMDSDRDAHAEVLLAGLFRAAGWCSGQGPSTVQRSLTAGLRSLLGDLTR